MADTSPTYRIWQSSESVLLQHESGWMELSTADAIALAAAITALLAPAPIPVPGEKVRWTQARSDECARLYIYEGLGTIRIAKRIGVIGKTVQNWLKKASVQLRSTGQNTVLARAALAAKRAAKRAA